MKKVLVIGELMSASDMENGQAFSDGNGRFTKAIMAQAGLDPRECKFINVFPITAARGSVLSLCGPREQGIPRVKYLIQRGKYVRAEYAPYLHNLWEQVNTIRPNLILTLGDAPLWALTSMGSLEYARGYVCEGNSAIPNAKILPTWSARQVQQKYALKSLWLADFGKAAREKEFPEIRYPEHHIWISPTLDDLEEFRRRYIDDSPEISVDIENKPGMITCVGFAPDEQHALVVPFFDSRKPDGNYWPTAREERVAWNFVQRMQASGKCIFGHNYSYDMQVQYRLNAITNSDFSDDTMLMHHAMQPELKKSLGFLASIYTNEVAWKKMRTDTLKKED